MCERLLGLRPVLVPACALPGWLRRAIYGLLGNLRGREAKGAHAGRWAARGPPTRGSHAFWQSTVNGQSLMQVGFVQALPLMPPLTSLVSFSSRSRRVSLASASFLAFLFMRSSL